MSPFAKLSLVFRIVQWTFIYIYLEYLTWMPYLKKTKIYHGYLYVESVICAWGFVTSHDTTFD